MRPIIPRRILTSPHLILPTRETAYLALLVQLRPIWPRTSYEPGPTYCVGASGRFITLRPDIGRVGRIVSGVVRGMGVTQFAEVGQIDRLPYSSAPPSIDGVGASYRATRRKKPFPTIAPHQKPGEKRGAHLNNVATSDSPWPRFRTRPSAKNPISAGMWPL